jgi:enolase
LLQKSAKNVGDEGGFAPNIEDPIEALDILEKAVKDAKLTVGKDIFFALDCAASEFYNADKQVYDLSSTQVLHYFVLRLMLLCLLTRGVPALDSLF